MRTLQASGDAAATEAIDLFTFRVAGQAAVMANSLGGLDCLVFTGGIGEHSSAVRQQICDRLRWLGVNLDASANDRADECINSADSKVDILVIATSEEMAIARHCSATLAELRSRR
jgi:acetate kinase